MADELIKVNTTDIEEYEDNKQIQDMVIAHAAKEHPDNPLYVPFQNETGIAKFGQGSLASMFGHDIHDLKGNVRSGVTEKVVEEQTEAAKTATDGLPILRYINLPGGSIEIKYYPKANVYVASKTIDGIRFDKIVETTNPHELLMQISDRACATQPVRQNKPIVASKRLANPLEAVDNETEETK